MSFSSPVKLFFFVVIVLNGALISPAAKASKAGRSALRRPSSLSPHRFVAAVTERKSAGLSNGERNAFVADRTTGLQITAAAGGYGVAGRGFSLRLTNTGEITDLTCDGNPLFDRSYLEVRDATWHIKLSPRAENVQVFPPRAIKDGERFHYSAQIDDAGTGIRLTVDENVSILSRGEIRIVLRLVPQAAFEAHRISWNVNMATDRFKNSAFSWRTGSGMPTTQQFPVQQAANPRLARNFDWMRVNCGCGPVDLEFSATGPQQASLPVENVLEDLRSWNQQSYWIATGAPYPHAEGDPDKAMKVPAGEPRTIVITIVLHSVHSAAAG